MKSSTDRERLASLIETLFIGTAIFISRYISFSFFAPKNHKFWYALYPYSRIPYCNHSFSICIMIEPSTFRYINPGLCQASYLIVLIFCSRVTSGLTLPKWLKSHTRAASLLNNIIRNRSFSYSVMSDLICSFSVHFRVSHDPFSIFKNFRINH